MQQPVIIMITIDKVTKVAVAHLYQRDIALHLADKDDSKLDGRLYTLSHNDNTTRCYMHKINHELTAEGEARGESQTLSCHTPIVLSSAYIH